MECTECMGKGKLEEACGTCEGTGGEEGDCLVCAGDGYNLEYCGECSGTGEVDE